MWTLKLNFDSEEYAEKEGETPALDEFDFEDNKYNGKKDDSYIKGNWNKYLEASPKQLHRHHLPRLLKVSCLWNREKTIITKMECQDKAIMTLIMLLMRLRRPILLILLMIAALMIIIKTLLPNRMHPKMPSYVTKTKNNLEKIKRTKCLTRFSYDNKKNNSWKF